MTNLITVPKCNFGFISFISFECRENLNSVLLLVIGLMLVDFSTFVLFILCYIHVP